MYEAPDRYKRMIAARLPDGEAPGVASGESDTESTPVKDVQLIGTVELTGISFQDGLFTDPVKGPQKLSGLNAVALGSGMRLFFCDTFDMGVAGNFGITGKYLVREQLRLEMRFRY